MRKILVITAIASLAGTSFANETGKTETGIDYNEVSIGYTALTASSTTYNGYNLSGGFLVVNNILLLADYASVDSNSISGYNLGVGYRLPIGSNVDAFTTLKYASMTQGTSYTGYSVGAGIRAKLTTDFDLSGSYTYRSITSSNTNAFDITLKYNITPNMFTKAGYTTYSGDSSYQTYNLGVGFNF